MTQKRELRPVLTKDLTSAIEQVIVDAQDAGVDLEDIDDSPRLEGRLRQDDNALNEYMKYKFANESENSEIFILLVAK